MGDVPALGASRFHQREVMRRDHAQTMRAIVKVLRTEQAQLCYCPKAAHFCQGEEGGELDA